MNKRKMNMIKTEKDHREDSKSEPADHKWMSPLGPWIHTLPKKVPPAFRAYRQFNDPMLRPMSGAKERIRGHLVDHFSEKKMPDKVARVLGKYKLLNLKEIIESFEFFQRVRHRVSTSVIADLCCGHGLVGILFALLDRRVTDVYLVDIEFPKSSKRVEEAISELGSWVKPKIHRLTRTVKRVDEVLPPGTGVVAVHACGVRTDWSIQAALRLNGSFAVMPCCYAQQTYIGPAAIKNHLGSALSIDIQRTYQIESADCQVSWQEIPGEITPMNRIISASPSISSISSISKSHDLK